MPVELRLARAKSRAGEDPIPELNRVIEFASTQNRLSSLFYALYEKAQHLSGRNDDEVFALLERCVDVIEGVRSDLRDVSLQVGALADKERIYGELLSHATNPPVQPELAFRIMERAKSRGLLDQMSGSRLSADPAAQDTARFLRRKIVRLLRRKFAQAEEVEGEMSRTKDRLATAFQRQFALRGVAASPVATDQIVRLATGDLAVLNYFTDPGGVYVCPASAGRISDPILLDGTSQSVISDLLDSLAFELESRVRCRSLEEFGRLLFEPVREIVRGVSRLLIIPDRLLHRVPFQALLSPEGRYLIEDFVITYAPSVSVALRRSTRDNSVAHGNCPSVIMGVGRTTYLPLSKLENVSKEIGALANLVPNASIIEGEAATRRTLLDLQGEIDVLLVACHGEFDRDDPLLSRLYLSDGPVYAYELLALAARPRLIVLSACETAVSAMEAGDESFGLVRPLLMTGAGAVLSSLWNVSDRAAAAFMTAFFERRRFLVGDAAVCLAETQRSMVQSSEYNHPYFWAPFMISGGSLEVRGNDQRRAKESD